MVKKKIQELEPGNIPQDYIDLLLECAKFRQQGVGTKEVITEYLENGGPLQHYVQPKLSYATLHRAYSRIKECHERFLKAKVILDKW